MEKMWPVEFSFDERSLERIDKLIAQGRYMETQTNLHDAGDVGDSACCAHRRVVAKTARRDYDGFIEGYWQCDSCESKFIPERPALETIDTLKALRDELFDELGKAKSLYKSTRASLAHSNTAREQILETEAEEREAVLAIIRDHRDKLISKIADWQADARQLCRAIEAIPASEQQTKASILASELHNKITIKESP